MRFEYGEELLIRDDFVTVRLPPRRVIYIGRYPVDAVSKPYMPEAQHVGVLADSGVPVPFRDSDVIKDGE